MPVYFVERCFRTTPRSLLSTPWPCRRAVPSSAVGESPTALLGVHLPVERRIIHGNAVYCAPMENSAPGCGTRVRLTDEDVLLDQVLMEWNKHTSRLRVRSFWIGQKADTSDARNYLSKSLQCRIQRSPNGMCQNFNPSPSWRCHHLHPVRNRHCSLLE